jgi:hypothetical protein
MGVVIGVDVGQKRDPTAICVVEPEERPWKDRTEVHYPVRYLERLALGTPYPEVAQRLAQVVLRARAKTTERPDVFVDATGVGQPVVDLLRVEAPQAQVIAVYFTHGDRRKAEQGGVVKLGKAWLVSRLQMLLQNGRLHLPRTAEAEALARELLDYEIRVSEDANDRYGAFRVGTHDDLVTALGLAVQLDPRLAP